LIILNLSQILYHVETILVAVFPHLKVKKPSFVVLQDCGNLPNGLLIFSLFRLQSAYCLLKLSDLGSVSLRIQDVAESRDDGTEHVWPPMKKRCIFRYPCAPQENAPFHNQKCSRSNRRTQLYSTQLWVDQEG
jgi:hypothetical protein